MKWPTELIFLCICVVAVVAIIVRAITLPRTLAFLWNITSQIIMALIVLFAILGLMFMVAVVCDR